MKIGKFFCAIVTGFVMAIGYMFLSLFLVIFFPKLVFVIAYHHGALLFDGFVCSWFVNSMIFYKMFRGGRYKYVWVINLVIVYLMCLGWASLSFIV